MPTPCALTLFQGRVGDHNDLALPGAAAIGAALAADLDLPLHVCATPEPALNTHWQAELDAARPALRALQARFDAVFASPSYSIAATSRCAASLATLPMLARHHPDTCVIWFDSHADLNTPATTTSDFLGGLALAAPLGLWDSGFGAGLSPGQIILVGQRDLDPAEQALIARLHICHLPPSDNLASALHTAIARRATYVHLDCDVLDPGIVPTDYSCAGGLSLDDLAACAAVIGAQHCRGIEIAEFQNSWFVDGPPVSPRPLLAALQPLLVWPKL